MPPLPSPGPAVAKRQWLTSLQRSMGALGKSLTSPLNPVVPLGKPLGPPRARAPGAVKATPVTCWAPLCFECGPEVWADVGLF